MEKVMTKEEEMDAAWDQREAQLQKQKEQDWNRKSYSIKIYLQII